MAASASESASTAAAPAVAVPGRHTVPSEMVVWAVRGGLLRGGSSRSGSWVEARRRPPEQLNAEQLSAKRRLVPRLALQQELNLPLLELSERAVRGEEQVERDAAAPEVGALSKERPEHVSSRPVRPGCKPGLSVRVRTSCGIQQGGARAGWKPSPRAAAAACK